MATRYNNRRIIKSIQTIAASRLLPGMILTFNYSEQGVTDSRPILLFLNNNKKNKNLDGLNLNYLNPTKLKKLFQVTDFKKTEIDEVENLLSLKEDYFRIQRKEVLCHLIDFIVTSYQLISILSKHIGHINLLNCHH